MYETLICEARDEIGEIRLNRPHCLNALSLKCYAELELALDAAVADKGVRAIMITGAGRSFCAGADLNDIAGHAGAGADLIQAEQDLARKLAASPKPLVAAVHGYALGAGAELALGCDFILMSETARFGLPEVGLGNFLGGGATQILPRLVGLAKARELVFLGEMIDGGEALRIGLANRCFPEDGFEAGVLEFARHLAGQSPLSMRLARTQLNNAEILGFEDVLVCEADAMAQCLAGPDWKEALLAKAEKRPPRFKGE
ncbi:MAG: enoyl-CoA hydratase/isomerase family protein [Alphaproteobacteria bacterium]|nr:enoyl-CoA hydratase/isomerase family protein [Alphaproteobacteria bacterium]